MDASTSLNPSLSRLKWWDEYNLRWYLGAQLVSFCGTMLQSCVLSLLVKKLEPENPAFWIGVVWALNFLPGAGLSWLAGVYVDRADKRAILRFTSLLSVAQAVCLAVLTASGLITIWHIVVLSLLGGILTALDAPARNAFVKDIVLEPGNEMPGTQIFSALWTVAQLVGPGLAGPLVLILGYGSAFAINALSFGTLLIALTKLRLSHLKPREAEPRAAWEEFCDGLAYTWGHSAVKLGVLLSTAITVFGFSHTIFLPVIAKELFAGQTEKVYSLLGGSYGLGSLLGSLVVIALGQRWRVKWLMILGCVIVGSCLLLLTQADPEQVPRAMVLMFICGAGYMFAFLSLRGALLRVIDKAYTGRVLGVAITFFFGSMMLGPFLGGLVVEKFGSPTFLIISGSVMLLIALITQALPGINELDSKQEK